MRNVLTAGKIVVPIDFSDESFSALDQALILADKPSNVHVLHALEMLAAMEPGIVWAQVHDEERRIQVTEALKDRLSGEKYQGVKLVVEFGDPGHCIADYAQDNSAELIVISSQGRTGVKRLMLGSVAERVIRLSHCPVLVLKN